LQNISSVTGNNKLLFAVNSGPQYTLVFEDGYYNADKLIQTIMAQLALKGYNGTAIINSDYEYVISA